MFEILDEVCKPTKGSKYSACIDLFAREDVVIGAGETKLVPLGVKIDRQKLHTINKSLITTTLGGNFLNNDFISTHQLNLHIRSSMSAKHGLIIANGTGIIDLDYEDEIMICLHNPLKHVRRYIGDNKHEKKYTLTSPLIDNYNIKKGDKIAQISLVEHKSYLFGVESEED